MNVNHMNFCYTVNVDTTFVKVDDDFELEIKQKNYDVRR